VLTEATFNQNYPEAVTISNWVQTNQNNQGYLSVDNNPNYPPYVPGSHNGEASIVQYAESHPGVDFRVVSGDAGWINSGVPSADIPKGRNLDGASGPGLTTTEFINDLLISGAITPVQHTTAVGGIIASRDVVGPQFDILLRPGSDPVQFQDINGNTNYIIHLGFGLIQLNQNFVPIDFVMPNGFLNLPGAPGLNLRSAIGDGIDFPLEVTTLPDGSLVLAGLDPTSLSAISEVNGSYNPQTGLIEFNASRSNGTEVRTIADTDAWTIETTEYDSSSNVRVTQTRYDDGSSLSVGRDASGNIVWTQSVDTEGVANLTHANGTQISFEDGIANVDYTPDWRPTTEWTLPNTDAAIRAGFEADGRASLSLQQGTNFILPAGSEVGISQAGLSLTPDFGLPGIWGFGYPDPQASGNPDAAFAAAHPSPLQNQDPLIFDLDGDGIELMSVQDSNAHFDYGGIGFAPKTGWVAASEGILIHDVDQNIAVTSNELFGAVSGNAFNDLAAFDTNADGKVDSNDTNFSSLKIWIDADGDGQGDAGELVTLSSLDIKAINLTRTASGENLNGNTVVETASFVRNDDTTGMIAEVNFATDALYSRYTPPQNFEFSSSAFLLPSLVGYGNVPDLIYSVSLDSGLEDQARDLVLQSSSMTGSEFVAAFENFVQVWAGVDGINPTSQGPLVDARHMALVEKFYGATFEQMNGVGATLNALTAQSIEATYQSILDALTVRFVAQVPLSQLLNGATWAEVESNPLLSFSSIKFDTSDDTIDIDFDEVVQEIVESAPNLAGDQVGYYDSSARILKSLRVDLFNEDKSALANAFTTAAMAAGLALGFQAQVAAEIKADRVIDSRDVVGSVTGTSGSDVILADTQNRTLSGVLGNDTYVVAKDSGVTTIHDGESSSNDALVLVDVDADEIALSRSGASDNLVISVTGGSTITIDGQFNKNGIGTIETISFADGNPLTNEAVMQRMINEASSSGNDSIYGFYREDILDGGAGNDYLAGGGEGDVYRWGLGGGNDTIYDLSSGIAEGADIDAVELSAGLLPADLTFARVGGTDDLIITIVSSGETLTIRDQFLKHAVGLVYGEIEELRFSDETALTAAYIRELVLVQARTSGDETIVAFHTADTLDGGAGNDTLIGNGGGDTFVFGLGYGQDIVNAYIVYVTRDEPDRIIFNADVAPEDLILSRSGDDLILSISGTDDRLTIADHFSSLGYREVEEFHFSDQTVWTAADILLRMVAGTPGDDLLIGGTDADYLDGGAGHDVLKGRQGDDTYVFGIGYGRDTIDDDNNSVIGDAPDRILFGGGIGMQDLEFVKVGSEDLLVRIIGTEDEVTIKGHYFHPVFSISNFELADGTTFTSEDVETIIQQQGPGIVTHRGTSAAETINGTGQADIIDGLGGVDTLLGGSGSDTYLFGAGSGNDIVEEDGLTNDVDTIKLVDLDPSDVLVGRNGYHLFITIVSTDETLKVVDHFSTQNEGIEQVVFADTTVWDRAAILAQAVMLGTESDETINGSSGADTIDGLGGADILQGGSGGDTYIYRAGSGNDTIIELGQSSNVDQVKLVSLNADDVVVSRVGDHLFITVTSTGEQLKVQEHFDGTIWGIEELIFADSTVWDRAAMQANSITTGTSSADTINGTSANETFDGLGGNDTISGGTGSDVYLYRAGSGNDTIIEYNDAGGVDQVKLLDLNPSDVTFRRSGYHLFITINATGEELKVQEQFFSTYGVEQIVFGDNTVWDRSQIQAAAWIRGTSGTDSLTGSGNADTIDGQGGNDTMNGGAGGDTYIFGIGSGNDTINENSDGAAVDKVRLVGLDPSDVTFSRTGDHLFITITSSGEQLKVTDHFYSTTYGVEQLIFDDNVIWDRPQILFQVPQLGTSGNDSMTGSSADNAFIGGLGNDTVSGSSGSDIYIYASGDGNDKFDENSASTSELDVVWFTDINPGDITLTRVGNDLMVNVTATGHQIELDEQYWNASQYYGLEQFRFADGTVWGRDQILQNAWWNGTTGNDTLSGWGSFDNIDGGSGNDTLNGNAGVDKLVGGAGNDTITGGVGNDVFMFRSGFGQDTITDFSAGQGAGDVVEFYDGLIDDFAELQQMSTQVGSGVVITVDGSNSITLQNTVLANLDQDDFRFL
jgi:Ca2+-binding RTX toxin-like protein